MNEKIRTNILNVKQIPNGIVSPTPLWNCYKIYYPINLLSLIFFETVYKYLYL